MVNDMTPCQGLDTFPQAAFSPLDPVAEGLSEQQLLAIEISVPVAALALIIVVVLLAVPSVRRKVFPFRDRAHHRFITLPPKPDRA